MNKIKENIIFNLFYQILVLIVPIITSPYISRVLGAEGVGIYSYISSISYYFVILITMGLNNYGNRLIAKKRDNKEERSKIFWSIYKMQFVFGIVVILLYFIFVFFVFEEKYRVYFSIYMIYIISAVFDINWFFFGLEKFKFTTIRNTIVRLLTVASVFLFIKTKEQGLVAYFFIVAGSSLISNLILWTNLFQEVKYEKIKNDEWIKHIKPNLILFIPILAMSIYRVMDKIMIKVISGVEQCGYYENADRIITISLTVFSAIATVMMPAVSNMIANNEDDKVKLITKNMMFIVIVVSLGMSFGLAAIGKEFAPLFFGRDFVISGYILIGLSPTIFLSGWKNIVRSQYLIPFEKDKIYVISLISGALVNVIVNLALIPSLGSIGAVVGTICAEVSGFIIQSIAFSKFINIRPFIKQTLLYIPGSFLMYVLVSVVLRLLPNNMYSIIISVLIGGAFYFIVSLLTVCLFDKEHIEIINSFMHLKSKK